MRERGGGGIKRPLSPPPLSCHFHHSLIIMFPFSKVLDLLPQLLITLPVTHRYFVVKMWDVECASSCHFLLLMQQQPRNNEILVTCLSELPSANSCCHQHQEAACVYFQSLQLQPRGLACSFGEGGEALLHIAR